MQWKQLWKWAYPVRHVYICHWCHRLLRRAQMIFLLTISVTEPNRYDMMYSKTTISDKNPRIYAHEFAFTSFANVEATLQMEIVCNLCMRMCVCERVKLIRNATVADERSIHTLRKYNKGNANEVCVNGVALDYRYMRQIYSVPSPKIIFAHNMIKYITHLTLNLCMRSLRWRTFGHRKKRWNKYKEKRQTATKNNWTKAS